MAKPSSAVTPLAMRAGAALLDASVAYSASAHVARGYRTWIS